LEKWQDIGGCVTYWDDTAGSSKANGREPKTCLGRVFNNKLGCLDDVHVLIYMDASSHQQLKTRPRFSPVSLSLSMDTGACNLYAFSVVPSVLCENSKNVCSGAYTLKLFTDIIDLFL
jgi:hypothetical protein